MAFTEKWRLSQRASQFSATQNVHVNVKNDLASIRTVIENNPVTIFEPLSFGQFGACAHEFTDQPVISFCYLAQIAVMLLGYYQEMGRRLG